MSGEQCWMAVWMKEAFDFHNISFLLFKFFNISMGISIITLKKQYRPNAHIWECNRFLSLKKILT